MLLVEHSSTELLVSCGELCCTNKFLYMQVLVLEDLLFFVKFTNCS